MTYRRYALFVTPGPGPLADFGSGWLGWDAATGTVPPPPRVTDLPLPRAELTETPRRYGFHGTLKPPFRLAPGTAEADLRDALRLFCSAHAPVSLSGLELALLGRFLALVPRGDTGPLDALAAATVRGFDRFRAPLTGAELARRRNRPLSPAQDALLQRWGYPFVMGEFRFHLTLTGRMPKPAATATRAALAPHLAPLLPAPFVIDSLSLMGEAADGRFRVIDRVPLAATAAPGENAP